MSDAAQKIDENKLHNTEKHNPVSLHCHAATILQNLQMINTQNTRIATAIEHAIPAIEKLVAHALPKMKQGGRLFYIGAGTSGRLGVLDASEMPPTYGTDPQMIQGIIAGGDDALRNAGEGAEDSAQSGIADTAQLTPNDILVGISASGSAAYVRGAVQHARSKNIYTAAICTAADAPLLQDADCAILAEIDGEIPAGSTRMFSGSAQKMILNMISTTIMIGLGKVYAGYMVDVAIGNQKLIQRAINMIVTLTGCPHEQAQFIVHDLAPRTRNPVKAAVVMVLEQCDYDHAVKMLHDHDDRIDYFMQKHGRDKALGQ